MFAKPTQPELAALARMSLDEFKPVLKYLEHEVSETQQKLVTTLDVEALMRLQGRAAVLLEFISLVRRAREFIKA